MILGGSSMFREDLVLRLAKAEANAQLSLSSTPDLSRDVKPVPVSGSQQGLLQLIKCTIRSNLN